MSEKYDINGRCYEREVLHDKRAKKTLKLRLAAAKAGYLPAKLTFLAHERGKQASLKRK